MNLAGLIEHEAQNKLKFFYNDGVTWSGRQPHCRIHTEISHPSVYKWCFAPYSFRAGLHLLSGEQEPVFNGLNGIFGCFSSLRCGVRWVPPCGTQTRGLWPSLKSNFRSTAHEWRCHTRRLTLSTFTCERGKHISTTYENNYQLVQLIHSGELHSTYRKDYETLLLHVLSLLFSQWSRWPWSILHSLLHEEQKHRCLGAAVSIQRWTISRGVIVCTAPLAHPWHGCTVPVWHWEHHETIFSQTKAESTTRIN